MFEGPLGTTIIEITTTNGENLLKLAILCEWMKGWML